MFVFPFFSSVRALETCFVIACACQLLAVKRYMYDSRGLLGKLIIFGLPCTAAVVWYSGNQITSVLLLAYLLPTLNIMGYCFKLLL